MTKAILECNGIAAGYVKGLNILQGVDLVVSEGEIVSIIGPNGAGKSTLLKAIMGLINVSAGRFYINGSDKTFHSLESSYSFFLPCQLSGRVRKRSDNSLLSTLPQRKVKWY